MLIDGKRRPQLIVYDQEKVQKAVDSGLLDKSKYSRIIISKGKMTVLPDVWEIDYLNSQAKERTGYPTQKPEELLERIIKVSSNKGDIIADFFCGCGTTLVASHKLGRQYLGVDNSTSAAQVIRKRLRGIGVNIKELALKSLTKAEILKLSPFKFEEYIVRCLGGEPNISQVRDGGIDGRLIQDGTPIQVKKSKGVGRPVIDSFHRHLSINGRGIIVALSFGKGAYEDVAKLKRKGYDIELLTIDDMLDYLKAA